MKTSLALLLAAALLSSSEAGAGTRQDLLLLADAIGLNGNHEAESRIKASLRDLTDEQLDSVYGNADLVGLAGQFEAVARTTEDIRATNPGLAALYDQIRNPGLGQKEDKHGKKDQLRQMSANLPPAGGYPSPYYCPQSPGRGDTNALLAATFATDQARSLLETAKQVWSGLSRACDQTAVAAGFGGNTSLGCIVADAALFAAELVVGQRETAEARLSACDAAVDSAELEGTFNRVAHLHDDMEVHAKALETHDGSIKAQLTTHDGSVSAKIAAHDGKLGAHDAKIASQISTHDADISTKLSAHDQNIGARLGAHDQNIATRLGVHDTNIATRLSNHDLKIANQLSQHDRDIAARVASHDQDVKQLLSNVQGAVNENQRLIKITMSRQLEIMRLLLTPQGQRVINQDVLECTGDDCPSVEELVCSNGSLKWGCK